MNTIVQIFVLYRIKHADDFSVFHTVNLTFSLSRFLMCGKQCTPVAAVVSSSYVMV